MAETMATWVAASDRVGQCGRCPPEGAACRGHAAAVAEGETVALGADLRVLTARCPRYEVAQERDRVRMTGLPDMMLDFPIERVLGERGAYPRESSREELYAWLGAVEHSKRSLLITGSVHVSRTRLLAAITRELTRTTLQTVHYTWAPRLAVRMREHLDKRLEQNPFERAESAHFVLIDFVDPKGPKPWAEWFLERMDGLIFERMSRGLVTVLSSPRRAQELREALPQSGGFFDPLVVNIERGFGPVFE